MVSLQQQQGYGKIMHKINFEVASERATIKEHMLLPPNDGQRKHPEHLNEHEMLQVLQRYALNGDVERTKEWILKFPEGKREDLRKMMIGAVSEHGRVLDI